MTRQLWRSDEESIRDKRALLTELAPAYISAANQALAAQRPGPGPELDLFVAAHAAARGRRDSPEFRLGLLTGIPAAPPAVTRYWALTEEVLGTHNTTGTIQYWLHTALLRSLTPGME